MNDYEISAYISQINGMFHNKKFSDIKDAFNSVIYPSNVYQNYKWIYYALYNGKYANDLIDIGIKKIRIDKYENSYKEKIQ